MKLASALPRQWLETCYSETLVSRDVWHSSHPDVKTTTRRDEIHGGRLTDALKLPEQIIMLPDFKHYQVT